MVRDRLKPGAKRIALLFSPYCRSGDITSRAIDAGLSAAYGALGHEVDVFFWQKPEDGFPLCEARPGGRIWRLRGWADLLVRVGDSSPGEALRACDFAHLQAGGPRGYRLLGPTGVLLWLVCRLTAPSLPIGVTMQDLFGNAEGSLFERKSRALLRRFVLRRSAWITAVSGVVRDFVIREEPSLAARVSLIPNGFDPSEASLAAASERAADGKKYVLCCARLAPRKGIDILLMAWGDLAPTVPGVELRIAGPDETPGHYQLLAEKLGVADRVAFLGKIDRPAIFEQLRGCLFSVLPSRTESFGMAALEAMAVGKAVIATKTGAADFVAEGVTGVLIEPGDAKGLRDAMNTLLEDAALRERLGAAARRAVEEKYVWAKIAQSIMSLQAQTSPGRP